MKTTTTLMVAVALSAAVTVGASAASQSGFLADYSKLSTEKDAAGDSVQRYISPELKPGMYQKVLIDAVQYYPAPAPSEYLDEATLTEIRNYVDNGLRQKIGAQIALADQPGPGVVRFRPAITAVAANSPGLKPYEILPIGFIISAAKGRGKEAALQIELEAVDSVSGQRLGAAVRKGVGAKLDSKEKKLTLEHVRPLLDKWIDTGSTFAVERLR